MKLFIWGIIAFFTVSLSVNNAPEGGLAGGGKNGNAPEIRHAFADDRSMPDDQYFDREWALHNDGHFAKAVCKTGADIKLAEAWKIEKGDSNIIVAVLDGGCNLNEPDLNGRIWVNRKEIPGNNKDDDHNGYIDDVNGWDFVNSDNNPEDETGHGTNVAGIIGAKPDNEIGYAGVDWNAKLMICKITDKSGTGYYRAWMRAIHYAVDNGAKVINMSVGGNQASIMLQNAIDYAYEHGVVVVASMMNFNNPDAYYPAACDHVIAVGATNPDDTRAAPFFWDAKSGSNYGKHIAVVAPGNYIYGLSPSGSYNTYWGGTSQAAPFVSGLASLLLAQDKTRTPDQIREIITSTADDMVGDPKEDTQGWDQYYGFGRINALRALEYSSSKTASAKKATNSQ